MNKIYAPKWKKIIFWNYYYIFRSLRLSHEQRKESFRHLKGFLLILWKNVYEIKPAGTENGGSGEKTYFLKFWLDLEYNQKKSSLEKLHRKKVIKLQKTVQKFGEHVSL